MSKTPTYIIERYHVGVDERWTDILHYETRAVSERVTNWSNDKGNKHGRYYRLVLNGEVLTHDDA
jgi:hypothetical protein